MDVNLKAAFNVSQVVASEMVQRGKGGSIVNVSSMASTQTLFAGISAYCASKGALDSLTQAMALELGPHKIRVNSVNPGTTVTPMVRDLLKSGKIDHLLERTSLGRFAEVSDVTNAVLFLLSDQAAMITGTTLIVDGGLSQR